MVRLIAPSASRGAAISTSYVYPDDGSHATPFGGSIVGALALGFVSYGLSLTFFIVGLRHIGAARTGAYFSTAPFIGALVAALFLHEPLTLNVWIAGALMAAGVWLHLTESREQTEQALKTAR